VTSAQLLTDAFERIREVVHEVVDGLTSEQLGHRIDDDANSIAWLVWHLTRVQDDHIAAVMGTEQVWTAECWAERFSLPLDLADTGYGHSSDQVASVQVASGDLLTGYYDAVHAKTVAYVSGLKDGDLTRIVDPGWDPPVTLSVRLVSVISDDLQHAGQAAIIRGIL
jgi:uncharacterized damage-inducible protein DinB